MSDESYVFKMLALAQAIRVRIPIYSSEFVQDIGSGVGLILRFSLSIYQRKQVYNC